MLPHPQKHGLRIMNSSIFQPLDVDLHQKLKTDYEWLGQKLAYMERRSLSGIRSSDSASSHGLAEWMEQLMAAENSDESEHDAENSDESEHDEVVKEEVEKDEYEHHDEMPFYIKLQPRKQLYTKDEVAAVKKKKHLTELEQHGNQDKFRITLDLEQYLGRWFDEDVELNEDNVSIPTSAGEKPVYLEDEYDAYIMKRLEMSSDDYDAYIAEFGV